MLNRSALIGQLIQWALPIKRIESGYEHKQTPIGMN